jgi:hypothetical protein
VQYAWASTAGLPVLTVTKSEPKKTDATPSMPNRRCARGESIASRAFLNSDTPDCRPAHLFSLQHRGAQQQRTMLENEAVLKNQCGQLPDARKFADPRQPAHTSITACPGMNIRLLGLGVGCVWMNMPRCCCHCCPPAAADTPAQLQCCRTPIKGPRLVLLREELV